MAFSLSAQAQPVIEDNGAFILNFKEAAAKDEAIRDRILIDEYKYETIVHFLNSLFVLDRDINIQFESWTKEEEREANASYYDKTGEIVMEYGLLSQMATIFDGSSFENAEPVYLNTAHTLFHEVGHALLNTYHIPFTQSNKEKLADELAFFLLKAYESEDAALEVIPFLYLVRSEVERGVEYEYVENNVHVPDADRAMNYMCWMIGATPALKEDPRFESAINNLGDRNCEFEFEGLKMSWNTKLSPFVK